MSLFPFKEIIPLPITRLKIAKTVSKKGSPKANKGTKRKEIVESFPDSYILTIANVIPIKPLPASPINISAFLKLYFKNPRHEAQSKNIIIDDA